MSKAHLTVAAGLSTGETWGSPIDPSPPDVSSPERCQSRTLGFAGEAGYGLDSFQICGLPDFACVFATKERKWDVPGW